MPGYHETIAAIHAEYEALYDVPRFPLEYSGRYSDCGKVKSWLKTTGGDPEPIRLAWRAYLQACRAGTSWPRGDPPTTEKFAAQFGRWLQTPPDDGDNGVSRDGPAAHGYDWEASARRLAAEG